MFPVGVPSPTSSPPAIAVSDVHQPLLPWVPIAFLLISRRITRQHNPNQLDTLHHMNRRGPSSSSVKRKQPESGSLLESLTEHDRIVYDVIRKKQDMGIWRLDLKRETNLTDNMVKKSLKTLQVKELIKEVKNIQGKGRIHYMAAEFEPSKEITGGDWYLDGNLDTELIKLLKDRCVKIISKLRVTTLDGIVDIIRRNNLDFKTQQLEEILSLLILDNEIVEVKSNGMNEFSSIPVGKVCYKCSSTTKGVREPRIGAMASIPCGVCPRISECTPDGIISPVTCEYYKKWLSF